ncbi:MAG: hypothetical protein LV481_03700 [Methylacidiphilales bacterium]|nr:hypothetical protein [Candidatus Methylacidiphilales bacterium]
MNPPCFFWFIWFGIISSLTATVDDSFPIGDPIPSSDLLFEVYSSPEGQAKDVHGQPYYYGEQIFVRLHGTKEKGVLLRQNSRWFDIKWAPHSHLLGLEDHWDGHSSRVYVYDICNGPGHPHFQARLVFISPNNDYDRQWFMEGWEPAQRKIRLRLEQRGNDAILGHEAWPSFLVAHRTFVIGTETVHDDTPND